MKRLLFPLLAALALPTAVNAEVGPKVHKMCLQAKDYLGCVKAHSGKSGPTEIITNPGTATSKGNFCPDGYAYAGEGFCKLVLCDLRGGKNSPVLRGKKWRCIPGVGRGHLRMDARLYRIGNNPNCPNGEPKIGWQSTCDAPYKEPPKSERVAGVDVQGPS